MQKSRNDNHSALIPSPVSDVVNTRSWPLRFWVPQRVECGMLMMIMEWHIDTSMELNQVRGKVYGAVKNSHISGAVAASPGSFLTPRPSSISRKAL